METDEKEVKKEDEDKSKDKDDKKDKEEKDKEKEKDSAALDKKPETAQDRLIKVRGIGSDLRSLAICHNALTVCSNSYNK